MPYCLYKEQGVSDSIFVLKCCHLFGYEKYNPAIATKLQEGE